jgi:hypothetical protein
MHNDTGISLFDSKGALLPLDTIEPQLDTPELKERFEAVRIAHQAVMEADADVAACNDSIKDGMNELAAAEGYLKEHYPAPSYMDLWREMKATRASGE